MAARRRLVVSKDDVLVIKGMELDVSILEEMLVGDKRLLWYFLKNKEGDVRPICVSEEQCIWLQESDLERTEAL